MKAGPVEIGRLLQNRWRFCVPIYQRHYVWSRSKQWEPFWSDVRTKAIERLANRDRRFSHFMGAVVLEARGGFSATRVPSFQVVDGQQRLTTFQLFLAAARDYAAGLGFTTTAENISGYLLNDKQHLMEDPEIEIYKVWPTQSERSLFIDIITLGRKAIRSKYAQHFYVSHDRIYDYSTVPRLLSAYGYFYDRIRHSVETDDLDDEFTEAPEIDNSTPATDSGNGLSREIKLDALWQALVEEFKVVEITLEEGDDAQVIFETLNERGEPLLAADLIRNNIFQRADAAREKAEELFAKYWGPFERSFWSVEEKQGRYKKPRIEFFFSNFIAGKIGGEVNLSKLFSEYKAFIKRQKYPKVADELQEVERFGRIYRELVERSADSALAQFSGRLRPWDVTTVFPFVLRLWENPQLADDQKARCLSLLLSFIVRRAVCGLTNKNYNKFFLGVVAHLDRTGWSEGSLTSFILAQTAETTRMPRDEEFEQRWLGIPAYSSLQPARAKAVLEEIERAKRTAFHETKALSPTLSVEHILPREWRKAWPLPDGTVATNHQMTDALVMPASDDPAIAYILRRNRLLDTFGNLTLLTKPFNASVSNGPFAHKRAALDSHSLLVLNREVAKHKSWGEEEIVARGRALFAVAKDLWPLPAVLAPVGPEAAL